MVTPAPATAAPATRTGGPAATTSGRQHATQAVATTAPSIRSPDPFGIMPAPGTGSGGRVARALRQRVALCLDHVLEPGAHPLQLLDSLVDLRDLRQSPRVKLIGAATVRRQVEELLDSASMKPSCCAALIARTRPAANRRTRAGPSACGTPGAPGHGARHSAGLDVRAGGPGDIAESSPFVTRSHVAARRHGRAPRCRRASPRHRPVLHLERDASSASSTPNPRNEAAGVLGSRPRDRVGVEGGTPSRWITIRSAWSVPAASSGEPPISSWRETRRAPISSTGNVQAISAAGSGFVRTGMSGLRFGISSTPP